MIQRDLWLATGNAKKGAELERMLAPSRVRVRLPRELGVPFEPVEDAPDFAGNARKKARELALLAHGVALGDDSGLSVDALGGRPGVLSARYGGPGLDDRGRLLRLLDEMRHVEGERLRTARFTCSLCLCGPDGEVRAAVEEHCEGVLLCEPQGESGFGYDPIFAPVACLGEPVPPSFAQLDAAAKDRLSHRGRALRALLVRLEREPALLEP